ncbi:MAG: lipid A deacylase LpxR family protein [bacterium]|nr:lipid A deacylase LpxR family protein [bacterium]
MWALPAHATNESWRVVFDHDNDVVIGGVDRHYTSGVHLSALAPSHWVPDWIAKVAYALPPYSDDKEGVRWGFALRQQMYTPEAAWRRDVIRDDRPYAGYLHLRFGVYRDRHRDAAGRIPFLDTLQLDVGVVGPAALAEPAQDLIHAIFPSPIFEGWDHQLDNEFALTIRRARDWRLPGEPIAVAGDLGMDVVANLTAEVGNVKTAASAGLQFRFGWRLPADFGQGRFSPRDAGAAGARFYLFAGARMSAIARDIFLDGNTFEDSHEVDKRIVVVHAPMGLALEYGRFKTQFSVIYNSEEFEGQDGADWYGHLSIIVDY